MSDLVNSAGKKVKKMNKHKSITGKTTKNAGESIPGPGKFSQILEKPLVENSSPNDLFGPTGQGNDVKKHQLESESDPESTATSDKAPGDKETELRQLATLKYDGTSGQDTLGMAGTGMDWKGGIQEGGKDSGSMVGLPSASLNQDSGAEKGELWKGKTLVDPQDGNGCLVGPVSTGLNHDKAVMGS
jgi:hypothetical protein